MKLKNKGKVYPSPSSSSSSSSSSYEDSLSIFNLLPTAILAMVSLLNAEDREVLAFLMHRSMEDTPLYSKNNKQSKKPLTGAGETSGVCVHAPAFDCACFDCYYTYWVRWNSSPNRELIDKAIDAFEEQPLSGEKPCKKGKRRDRIGRRVSDTPPTVHAPAPEVSTRATDDVATTCLTAVVDHVEEKEAVSIQSPAPAVRSHKSLVRKVLPDLLGIFNSRLLSLWGPN